MFKVGQKVILLTSSCNKSGPIKGSTGYITGAGLTQKIKNLPIFINQASIAFTSFGLNENKNRSEQKNIMAIFPVLGIYKSSDIKKKLAHFVDTQDKETKTGEMAKLLRKQFGTEYFNAIVAPIDDRLNLITCPDNEFTAWLNCQLLSEVVRQHLIDITQNQKAGDKFKGTFDLGTITDLCNMAYDKGVKATLMPGIVRDPKLRETYINALRTVSVTGKPRYDDRVIDYLKECIAQGRFGGHSASLNKIHDSLMPYIYDKSIWQRIVRLFIEKKIGIISNKFQIFTKEIEIVQTELETLSRSLRSL